MRKAQPFQKRLTLPGLKPSDYFLFKSEREYFGFDTRELLVLGLRVVYSAFHGPLTRAGILALAQGIHEEDLDSEDKESRPVYKALGDIPLSSV